MRAATLASWKTAVFVEGVDRVATCDLGSRCHNVFYGEAAEDVYINKAILIAADVFSQELQSSVLNQATS